MEWLTKEIDKQVIPKLRNCNDKMGTKGSGAKAIVNSIGEFPKDFSGNVAFSELKQTQIPLAAGRLDGVPGYIDMIGGNMSAKDKKSLYELIRKFKDQKSAVDRMKAKSIIYAQTGNKNPSNDEIVDVLTKGVKDTNAKDLSPAAEVLLNSTETGAHPVGEYVVGLFSGGLSYVDETVNGIFGLAAYGYTLFTNWGDEDATLKAVQASYNAQMCHLSSGYDSIMRQAGINVDSTAYGLGKTTGYVATGIGVSFALPAGNVTKAYQITTAFTTTFGTTVKSDVDGIGGVDNLNRQTALNINNHALCKATTSAVTTWGTDKINSSHSFGQHTGGDLNLRNVDNFRSAWQKGGTKVVKNAVANAGAASASSFVDQYWDNVYKRDQFGKSEKINWVKVAIDGTTAGGVAFGTSVANLGAKNKSITEDELPNDKYNKLKQAEKEADKAARNAIKNSNSSVPAKIGKTISYNVSRNVDDKNGAVPAAVEAVGTVAAENVKYYLFGD